MEALLNITGLTITKATLSVGATTEMKDSDEGRSPVPVTKATLELSFENGEAPLRIPYQGDTEIRGDFISEELRCWIQSLGGEIDEKNPRVRF